MTNLSNEMQRYESMLFDYGTTHRSDYHHAKLYPKIATTYKEKRRCYEIRPSPLKDLHSMTDWKVPNIRFDMFLKPDPIIRGNPKTIQKRFEAPIDVELKNIRKTRPRMIMTPGVSLDDIKDDTLREMLTSDTYTSTVMYANREMASRLEKSMLTKAPRPDRPACARPIYVPSVKPPRVPPEWRMDSVSWEGRQLRSYVEPTKEFWLGRKELNCQVCKNTAEREALNAMKTNLKKN